MLKLWQKLSRLGVDDNELFDLKEVVLLNKFSILASIFVLLFIPFEVLINGWAIVPIEVSLILLVLCILIFNKYKYYNAAKFYFIAIATITIFSIGIAVGGNTNNEFYLVCIMISSLMFFKKMWKIILISCVTMGAFFLQRYIVDKQLVEPIIYISDDAKGYARNVFLLMTFAMLVLQVYYFQAMNVEYQKMLEKKNNEILASINYAKRIQNALLPLNEYEQKSLKEHFIIFKPKDIVSGDFYWIQEKGDTLYIAVADCTGHGVPGAFLSMLGISFLNEINLNHNEVLSPAEILEYLREKIITDLSQKENSNKDGMDISLISINKTTLEAQWAGANNPLYILRHSEGGTTDESTIETLKPDKQPIAIFTKPKPFTNHKFSLAKDDIIYLFSDGYADQFGGVEGKKIGYKRFKEKLTEVANLPMHEQQTELENYFETWKTHEEQIDDVCVVGVKI